MTYSGIFDETDCKKELEEKENEIIIIKNK